MSLAVIADHVASKGRGPDSMLIHMSPSEVHGLQALAQMHGGSLTINPETGLPEAGWLDKLLPAVIGFAINTFAPGVGTAIGETLMGAGAAGAGAVGTGLLVGGAQAVRTGSLAEGISAGLGAYGGANLAGSLAGTGGNILATTEAARIAGDEAVRNGLAQGLSGAEIEAAKAAAIDQAASTTPSVASSASPWEKISKGFEAASDNPQSALRANAKNLMYAAGPAIMAGAAVQSKMPQTVTQTGTIRPYTYDPYGGTYTAQDPYQYTPPARAADGGLMGYGESSNAPITRRNIDGMQNTNGMFNYAHDGGGVMRMAHGGLAALAFADGGGIDMFSPYVDLLAHPEKSGFVPGAERDAYMADIQAKQDELNQRIMNRQTAGGGTAQTINWLQSPSGLNPSLTQPVAQASAPAQGDANPSGFTAGGGSLTDAEYQKAVAAETARRNAENAAQDAYQIPPDSPFYAASKVATGDRLNSLKNSAYEFEQQQKNRAAVAAAHPGEDFVSVGPNINQYNQPSSKFGVQTSAPVADTSGAQASDALRSQATQQLLKDTGAYAKVGAPFAGEDGLAFNGPRPSQDVIDKAWAKYYATLGGSGAPTAGTNNAPTAGANNVPTSGTNTPSAAQQYKDQHLVDPTTGHLVNPTLTPEQLRQMRDGINTNAEMRQAYDSYWNTVKPGDILDFAGGTLTMNPNGTATHTYKDANGRTQSYTFDKSTDFATVAISDPNIAAEWKSMFNYTIPSGGGGGGGTTTPPPPVVVQPNIPNIPPGGFTGMNDVRNAYTAGGGSLGYTPYVPTSMADFEAKYNKLTGGSKQAYDYLMGKTEYSPTPWTPTGEIMKPYAESVLGVPGDVTKKKYLFDPATKQYKLNPAYVPPKPYQAPAEGKEWTWDATAKKWVQSTVKKEVVEEANGGLLALAGGGMAGGGQYNLGGYSDGGRLLRGPGDGVSDSIPATIGHKQPARLADGEFVVPARIVSELGNGSTEAGARKLYAMMDRVQSARRHSIGKGNVAKNSRADKYLPV